MKKYTLLFCLSFLLFTACSSKKPEKKPIIYPNESPEVSTTNPKEVSVTAKQIAAEEGTQFVTEIKFSKGEENVSENHKGKIRATFLSAKKRGEMDEVQLITWADKEFPTKKEGELDSTQKKLVEQRNENLEAFVKELDKTIEVKQISMAERAGALARFTSTKEAEVKEALGRKSAPGKMGEAIIVFLLKK